MRQVDRNIECWIFSNPDNNVIISFYSVTDRAERWGGNRVSLSLSLSIFRTAVTGLLMALSDWLKVSPGVPAIHLHSLIETVSNPDRARSLSRGQVCIISPQETLVYPEGRLLIFISSVIGLNKLR